jgi:peptidoglycan/xylan/chitin deacetylase (PgdA/CDA1 family)
MLGQNVKKYPKVVQRKAQLGMELGSHTWSHPNLLELKKKEIKTEISKTNNALVDACGQSASVFRPPYGNVDDKVLETVDMPAVLWSVDTLDWKSRKSKSVVSVVKKVEKEDGLDGRVILMHSLYPSTAKATEILVPWLKKKGYQLVTVSELLQYRYNENPQDGKLYGYGYFYLN